MDQLLTRIAEGLPSLLRASVLFDTVSIEDVFPTELPATFKEGAYEGVVLMFRPVVSIECLLLRIDTPTALRWAGIRHLGMETDQRTAGYLRI